jgi:hypothetical protein
LDSPESLFARRLTLAMPLLMRCHPELAWLCEAARMAHAARRARHYLRCLRSRAAEAGDHVAAQLEHIRRQVSWPQLHSLVDKYCAANSGVSRSEVQRQVEARGFLEEERRSLVSEVVGALRSLPNTASPLEALCRSWLERGDSRLSEELTAAVAAQRSAAVTSFEAQLQQLCAGYQAAEAPCALVPAAFGLRPAEGSVTSGGVTYGGVDLNARVFDSLDARGDPPFSTEFAGRISADPGPAEQVRCCCMLCCVRGSLSARVSF